MAQILKDVPLEAVRDNFAMTIAHIAVMSHRGPYVVIDDKTTPEGFNIELTLGRVVQIHGNQNLIVDFSDTIEWPISKAWTMEYIEGILNDTIPQDISEDDNEIDILRMIWNDETL